MSKTYRKVLIRYAAIFSLFGIIYLSFLSIIYSFYYPYRDSTWEGNHLIVSAIIISITSMFDFTFDLIWHFLWNKGIFKEYPFFNGRWFLLFCYVFIYTIMGIIWGFTVILVRKKIYNDIFGINVKLLPEIRQQSTSN